MAVSCEGVVKHVYSDISIQELQQVIKSSKHILDIRRLNRKITINSERKYLKSSSVVMTFVGVILPGIVEIYKLPFQVTAYVSPVTQ